MPLQQKLLVVPQNKSITMLQCMMLYHHGRYDLIPKESLPFVESYFSANHSSSSGRSTIRKGSSGLSNTITGRLGKVQRYKGAP